MDDTTTRPSGTGSGPTRQPDARDSEPSSTCQDPTRPGPGTFYYCMRRLFLDENQLCTRLGAIIRIHLSSSRFNARIGKSVVTIRISNKRTRRLRPPFDLTHTSGVAFLLSLISRELAKGHSHRLSRVTAAVPTCYYLVAQTGLRPLGSSYV